MNDFAFQDLLENPKYYLLLTIETAGVSFFSDASEDTMPNEALLWKKTQNNSKSFVENFHEAEQAMLNDPNLVLFGPTIKIESDFEHYPCNICFTSKILVRVNISKIKFKMQ